jgi:hypothetical protein
MQYRDSLMPTGWRHHLWLALLVAASIAFSLGFACAVPFAAFGAVAALTLSRRNALLLMGAVWLANQLVGYGLLDYPRTVNSFAWGAVLGVASALTTIVAREAVRRFEKATSLVVAPLAAFMAAFVAYEATLFVVAAALLGGVEDFTPGIIGQVFTINAVAMIGLLVINRLGTVIGLAAPLGLPLPAMERQA